MQHDLLAQPKQSHQKSLGKTCVKVDLHICSKSKQTLALRLSLWVLLQKVIITLR